MLKYFILGYLVFAILGLIIIIIGSSKIGYGTLFERLANKINRWTSRGITLCLVLFWTELLILMYMAINELFIF